MNVSKTRDPQWLAAIRITPAGRGYLGDTCDVCPAPSEYGIDMPVCREHALAGRCFTCGEPMTCFGRAPGDYVCEGVEENDPRSVWYHEHGPYVDYRKS